MQRAIILAVALTGMAAGESCRHAQNDPRATPIDLSSRQQRVPGEYLVALAPGVGVEAIANLYGRFGIKSTKDIGQNTFVVTLTEDPGPARMQELRLLDVRIKAVQPSFVYRTGPMEGGLHQGD